MSDEQLAFIGAGAALIAAIIGLIIAYRNLQRPGRGVELIP